MSPQQITLVDIGRTYWPILAASFLVSVVATPICRRIALRWNLVDRPDEWLKPHKKPVAYLGGLAIFLGWAAGVLLSFHLFEGVENVHSVAGTVPTVNTIMMAGIFLAGLGVMVLGLLDDLSGVSAKVKLFATVAAGALLMLVGLGDDSILMVLRSSGLPAEDIPPWLLVAYSVPLTIFITVGACNATNLIDGVDGLCSGVLGIIAAGFLVLSINHHLWSGWHPWTVQQVTISLAMMGAALGFLPFNRNPARIFMGDAGSMLLGLNAAILILLFLEANVLRWLLASIMVFGLPLADMSLTLVRRWRNERPLMKGDRSHFYDQLLDRGWPVHRVVKISYALAAVYVVFGCLAIQLRTRYIVFLYGLVVLATVWLIAKFKMVRLEKPRQPDRAATREA
ncbi:MAG: undecaprenyl/decaprenyl-phosphate alpha-N-acetylglucosaminyl 1-phosphate transferase [Planctomycetes bacterium]|nr:undecaprenyl/decaprenyl-phosphate alpha-N-acetylglucosaminyl 1-phosphate transferase [Planctomycetota bacterium]